eukprot:CAMPEP_0182882276 /NCGR_PEP_ID=MMETSP0034_2-20130328/17680_1 /TAXON_ID=156128 /ORGANISM="Nephroselmis pyriformis, Strain CCMP717" /LENGTH=30 /DNA_ID= /DNA_START= /DNA_END= /DNA_ORIENTATION=
MGELCMAASRAGACAIPSSPAAAACLKLRL